MAEPSYNLPTREDIERFATQLTDENLQCRSWGHQRRQQIVRRVGLQGTDRQAFEIVFDCRSGCRTQWVLLLDTENGIQLASYTRYDPKYLATGIGRIAGVSRGIVRLEAIRRAA